MDSVNIVSSNGMLTELKETDSIKKETNIQYYTKYRCPICYEIYEKPILARECNHALCILCFEKLTPKKCSICRLQPISIRKPDDSEIAKLNAILIKADKKPLILASQQQRDWLADGAKKHNDYYEDKYQPSGPLTPPRRDLSTSEDFASFNTRFLNWYFTRDTTHLDQTIRGVRVSTCSVFDAGCWETCIFWPQGDSRVVWRGDTLEEAQSFHASVTGLLERFNFDSLDGVIDRITDRNM